jgi:hypothetical protein
MMSFARKGKMEGATASIAFCSEQANERGDNEDNEYENDCEAQPHDAPFEREIALSVRDVNESQEAEHDRDQRCHPEREGNPDVPSEPVHTDRLSDARHMS